MVPYREEGHISGICSSQCEHCAQGGPLWKLFAPLRKALPTAPCPYHEGEVVLRLKVNSQQRQDRKREHSQSCGKRQII